ncbi:hypothetical protein, partial [Neisseria cinerea]|uniref:hypothetical protein n=1 Tax=Neisseria cinerea TaxID=483 RepID=UPI002B1E4E8C
MGSDWVSDGIHSGFHRLMPSETPARILSPTSHALDITGKILEVIQYPDSPFKLHHPFPPARHPPTSIAV